MKTPHPYQDLSNEDLEDEIAALSSAIQAATFRLLCLIGEMDRRDRFGDPMDPKGFRSTATWLSWRVGLSAGSAREHVRVARALPGLEKISKAFSRGELSYSKVRAITRIANADNEDMLLDWAMAGTASHVEKLVRKYRQADRARETDRAKRQHQERKLVAFYDHDGQLVIQGRLKPEQGALLMKALEVAQAELAPADDPDDLDDLDVPAGTSDTPRTPECPSSRGRTPFDAGQRMADALARVAERSLAAGAAEASSQDRFQVVVHVDAEVLADPEADGRCELESGPVLAAETARRLSCDGSVLKMGHGPDNELIPGRKSRVISAPLRRALLARDGSGCRFPGCHCRGREGHHVEFWAKGGPTVLQSLLILCKLSRIRDNLHYVERRIMSN